MSKDKYPIMFSPQTLVIVFIFLQICFAMRAALKILKYIYGKKLCPRCSYLVLQVHVTNGFVYATRVTESACGPSTR